MKLTLLDSGDSVRISGKERQSVEGALDEFVRSGARVSDVPHREGNEWAASCRRSEPPGEELQVERLGHRLLVRSRSLERLQARTAEFVAIGVVRQGEIFRIDGFYTAVFYDRSGRIES